MFFTPKIIISKPMTVKPDGWIYIELAAWQKKDITDLIKKIETKGELQNLNISKETITDIYMPHLFPKLTKKQKEVVTLAYRNGYYEFPKKTNIEKLSKSLKLSPSTFQEHLRKAEARLLPFFADAIARSI